MRRRSNVGVMVRTSISLTWTDGEQMYDHEFEVQGIVEREPGGNGWATTFHAYNVEFSAPDGDLDTSRAVMWDLPSDAELQAADALEDKAAEDWEHLGEEEYETVDPDEYTVLDVDL